VASHRAVPPLGGWTEPLQQIPPEKARGQLGDEEGHEGQRAKHALSAGGGTRPAVALAHPVTYTGVGG